MKIGMLVGAVGLALAGAAYADNGAAVADSKAVLDGKANAPRSTFSVDAFQNARTAAIGARGSATFNRNAGEARRAIESGFLDARRSLFDATALGLKTYDEFGEQAHGGEPSLPTGAQPRAGDIPSTNYAYFDGFETYTIWTSPGVHPIPAGPQRLNGQVEPSGIAAVGSSMFAVTSLPQAAVTGTWTHSPAVPIGRNPYNPGMTGGYPADRDAAVEQALMNGTGARIAGLGDPGRLTGFFLGYRIHENGLYAPQGTSMMFPQGRPVVVVQDWYFGSTEYGDAWSPSSTLEGFIATRVLWFGYDFGSTLSETNGKILRPQTLGPLPGSFTIGDFFATPKLTGALPTFVMKTGQWFSVAFRLSLNDTEVFVRDTGTNGTTFLIDDSRDIQFFESGWSSIFPGQDAVLVAGTTWRGYGRAVNEFGEEAPRPAPILAGITVDNTFTLIGGDPTTTALPTWQPANWWTDNHAVIGATFVTPPQPKRTIPYKDDIELYNAGPLSLQGSSVNPTWTDNLSSRAVVTTSFNTSPSPGSDGGTSDRSIQQTSIVEDSSMRQEFRTNVPPGLASAPDFDPNNRAYARPGSPVSASYMARMTNTQTVRGVVAVDNDSDFTTEFLCIGGADVNDIVDGVMYIRLANPLFDPTMPTASGTTVDARPPTTLAALTTQNAANVNWPTLTSLSVGSTFKAECVLYGDGTAEWKINGTALTFNSSFYSLSASLEDELKAAKRIQLGLGPMDPVSGPYTRFLSIMKTLDQMDCWSGNNLGGFGDSVFVDDVCVNATLRVPGAGPVFALPLCDDFSNYNVDESIGGQGDGPFVLTPTTPTNKQRTIRGSWIAAAPGAVADWCSYTIQEIIPQVDRNGMTIPDPWGFAINQTIFVKKAFAGQVCPTRPNVVGTGNLTLLDPATMTPRTPGVVRVTSNADVLGTNGAAANFRADNDRYLPTSYFCRYTVNTIVAAADPGNGGTPFPLPSDIMAGSVVAVDSLFAAGNNGIRNCPGTLGTATSFRIWNAMNCTTATGTWTLLSSAAPTCGDPTPVAAAVNNTPNTDVKGYGFNFNTAQRWDDLLDATFAASGFGGDSWVRNGQSRLDDVKTALAMSDVSIDPAGAFGKVVEFENIGAVGPAPRAMIQSGGVTLPTAATEAPSMANGNKDKRAVMCYDLYVQDNNTRIGFLYAGAETDCDGGAGTITSLRFGGPDADGDGVPAGNIARLTSTSTNIWADTGVAVPVGQWFRVCLELDSNGNWAAGMNTTGTPGGPGDPPDMGLITSTGRKNFALPGAGPASPNAVFIAQGAALATESTGGAPLHTLRRLVMTQGADEAGDGAINLPAVDVETLGPTAARPAGLNPFDFCFYELQTVDSGASTMIANIDPVSGSSDTSPADGNPDLRVISSNTSDVIAVRFNSVGPAPIVTSFNQCPVNGDFRIFAAGSGGMGTPASTGTWQLLGIPDTEGVALPKGGVSNAAGPGSVGSGGNLKGYNDPNRPTRNILLAKWTAIPPIPAVEIASKWWMDNLCLKVGSIQQPTPCPADLTGDGMVGAADLAFLLGAWGPNPGNPADLNHDGTVGAGDLALLLGSWGPCPP